MLYRFCVSCPEEKAFDCLLSRICAIINQCLEKSDLPVPEMSPAKFLLPGGIITRAGSVESSSDAEGHVCKEILNNFRFFFSIFVNKKFF